MNEYKDLREKSIEELQILRNNIYDKFIEDLNKVPLDIRDTFNYYINLARTIDIIIDEKIELLKVDNIKKNLI